MKRRKKFLVREIILKKFSALELGQKMTRHFLKMQKFDTRKKGKAVLSIKYNDEKI